MPKPLHTEQEQNEYQQNLKDESLLDVGQSDIHVDIYMPPSCVNSAFMLNIESLQEGSYTMDRTRHTNCTFCDGGSQSDNNGVSQTNNNNFISNYNDVHAEQTCNNVSASEHTCLCVDEATFTLNCTGLQEASYVVDSTNFTNCTCADNSRQCDSIGLPSYNNAIKLFTHITHV